MLGTSTTAAFPVDQLDLATTMRSIMTQALTFNLPKFPISSRRGVVSRWEQIRCTVCVNIWNYEEKKKSD
jgi:hypothetical protein